MSRHLALVILLLGVAGLPASASTSIEWQLPGAGIVRLYAWNDDIISDITKEDRRSMHRSSFEEVSLMETDLSEAVVETRIHANSSGADSGAGLGSGAGKGGVQANLSMADANAVASKAAAAKAAAAAQRFARSVTVRGAAGAKTKEKQPLTARSWFSWMRFSLSFAFVIKTLCMACNIFYQASPLPLISDIKAKGDTGNADLAPFIAVAYGGWQWCFYGLFAYVVTQKSGFLVLVYSNVVGATLGLYYVYAFTLNCSNAAMLQRSTKYYQVLACVAAVQFVAILTAQPVRALFFSGLVSSAWSVVGSMSLISTVPTVYERRSSASLPVPLLVMGELSALLWIICGVMLWDPWITFPNTFSFGVCTFALYLCWKFPAHGAADDLEEDERMPLTGKEVDEDQKSCDFDGRASPLQRALSPWLSRSSSCEKDLHEPPASARRASYGGTGGTGDGF